MDADSVTAEFLTAGGKAFADSFEKLLPDIDRKRQTLAVPH